MAAGSTLCEFEPNAARQPATNMGTLDVRNVHLVLDFDTTTVETVYFEAFLPANYSGLGITVTLVWMATSATTGGVVWSVSWERMDAGTALGTDSFATEKTVTATKVGAGSDNSVYSTIDFANGSEIDSVSVGEKFRLRVRRNCTTVGDDMAGDAELLGVLLTETV